MSIKIQNTDNFDTLRKGNSYYVDKTGFLEKFLESPADASLFTRPRRFGKTLFMSMLASFFDIDRKSRELFAGLKVAENEELCAQWMNQYPVIFLTLKGVETLTYAEAVNAIQIKISDICTLHDDVLNNNRIKARDRSVFQKLMDCETNEITLRGSLLVLTRVLFQHYNKPVILLIDEYDVPVAKAADKGYYDEMIVFMRGFLTDPLKTNPYLKFGILTGVLRITKQSIFSDLNNLDCFDITEPLHSNLFGFTQNEVDQLLADAGFEDKREEIRKWYDGYHFGKQQEIYCPWSIMKYLTLLKDYPQEAPRAYWVGVTKNELTKGFHDRIPATVQDDMASLTDGKSIAANINMDLDYTQVYSKKDNFWTLLYLTGYLTPVDENANTAVVPGLGQTLLAIPNREVREAFETDIKSWFENIVPEEDMLDDFFQPFWDGDATKFEQNLHERLLLSSSFRDYRYREYFYHSLLLGIFMLKYTVASNREAGNGVFDLTVVNNDKNIAAVIEIKRADSEKALEVCVDEALQQIEKRQYDAELKTMGYTKVFHWGMAFFKKACKMGVRCESAGRIPSSC